MNKIKKLTITAALLAATTAFGQNLLLNGSFEDNGQTGATVSAGITNSSTVTGWNLDVTSGSTAFTVFPAPAQNEPNPADGSYIFNIGGFNTTKGVGQLWQDFATTLGQTYTVSYYFGRGNNDSVGSDTVSLNASLYNVVGGATSGSALASNDSGDAPLTGATSDLTYRSFEFTATGDTSRILLSDTSVSSGNSIYMDAISVTQVPEPTTAGMIGLGACVIGLATRRRRNK